MRVHVKIARAIVFLGSAGALGSGVAGAAGSNFDSLTQPAIHTELVTPTAAVRLKAAGLDPAAAGFKTALAAEIAHARARLATLSTHGVTAIAFPTRSSPLFHTGAVASIGSQAGLGGSLVPGAASLQVLAVEDFFAQTSPKTPAPMPGQYLAAFKSSNTSLPSSSATITIDVPDCGIHANGDANFIRADSSQATVFANTPIGLFHPTYYGTFYMLFGGQVPTLPLGSGQHAATFSFATPNTVTPVPIGSVTGTLQYVTNGVSVEENGVLATDGGLGLNANNSPTANLNAMRVNTGTTPMTGTDIIGEGITLGRGVTATATVTAAESIADVGASSPDNAYRGATVTVQPQAGRLQTEVSWHVGPGDSLAYTVQWKFLDPIGQRVVTSIPTTGPCDF